MEYINHFGAVRLRVVGSGSLRLTLVSLDEIYSQELIPIGMEITTAKTPTQLANFNQLVAKLRIETTEINEVFNIGQILIYTKPVSASFPQ